METASFQGLAGTRTVHVVNVDQVAVQVAAVLHLQRERAVAEDAHVTLQLGWRRDLVGGRFRVVGHFGRPSAGTVQAGVVAALRGAVADVTSSLVAAVDALVIVRVGRFAPRARRYRRRR